MSARIDPTYPVYKGEVVENRQTPAFGWIAITIMVLVVLLAVVI